MVYSHEAEVDKHVKCEELVFRDVCNLTVKRFDEKITSVQLEVKELKSDIKVGFREIKELIQAQK